MSYRKINLIPLLIAQLLYSIAPSVFSQTTPLARITVEAGNQIRINTPVSIPLEIIPAHDTDDLALKLKSGVNEKDVPCQVEQGISPKLWWIIQDTLHPGEQAVYLLYKGNKRDWPILKTTLDDEKIVVLDGVRPILQYNHAPISPPEGVDSSITRGGFIHPLWSPTGDILTRIQAPDHYHHYGIWNPWTKTHFEGREVDFWNLGSKKGTVRFKSFLSTTGGPVYSGFQSLHDHVDLTPPEGEKVAMYEEWDVRIWNFPLKNNVKFWSWDFTSTLCCATSEPVMLDQYRYGGGIGFRATELWTDQNSHILTSEGKTRENGDGTNARWCMIHGEGTKGISGILFMSHPKNREHPEPMRIWPVQDKYVYFQFCPIRHKEWEILPGNKYTLTYRILIYSGTITPEFAERLWRDFAYPPTIKFERID